MKLNTTIRRAFRLARLATSRYLEAIPKGSAEAVVHALVNFIYSLVWEATRPAQVWSFAMNCFYTGDGLGNQLSFKPQPEDLGFSKAGVWLSGDTRSKNCFMVTSEGNAEKADRHYSGDSQHWCMNSQGVNLNVSPYGQLYWYTKDGGRTCNLQWYRLGEHLELQHVTATFGMSNGQGKVCEYHQDLPIKSYADQQYVDLFYRDNDSKSWSLDYCFVHAVLKASVR